MADDDFTDDSAPEAGKAIPRHRVARLARFGGLASGIAGQMVADGAKSLAKGERPKMSDLLLTPSNAKRVADQLAQLRGAAMKVGQLLSMDAGDLIPPELSEVLARLRSSADPMPAKQLKMVLTQAWGRGWLRQFEQFDPTPLAAASIGQVHRAKTKDGRDLAIKIQYPGVKDSIDSDVDNLTTLIKMTQMLPKHVDLAPILTAAKAQLHEEADYIREGAQLVAFQQALAGNEAFTLPSFHEDLTTDTTLAMGYVDGMPIEEVSTLSQEVRDRVASQMIGLVLSELFGFSLMQTDPNFANYLYNEKTQKIVLLDFGASREFAPKLVDQYRELLRAGLADDRERTIAAAMEIGLVSEAAMAAHGDTITDIFELSLLPFRTAGVFDFGATDFAATLRDAGLAFQNEREVWHVPPSETLFLHRKIGGVYLLASRLRAKVDLQGLLAPFV